MAHRSRVAARAAALKPDLFHVHEPELLGPVIARAGSTPVIWDVHESYLDVLAERKWIPAVRREPAARLAWNWRERRLVARCAGVVVVTERIAKRYRQLHARVDVVANYPDLSRLVGLPPAARDGRTCCFVGGIDPKQGLKEAVSAIAILQRRNLSVPLVLAGRPVSAEYLQWLLTEAKRLGVGASPHLQGVLSKSEAIRLQNQASIGLVPYLPLGEQHGGNAEQAPGIDGARPSRSSTRIFRATRRWLAPIGRASPSIRRDPERIADAIEYLVKNPESAREMGENGQRGIREQFNWSVERDKLLDLYRNILGEPGRRDRAIGRRVDRMPRRGRAAQLHEAGARPSGPGGPSRSDRHPYWVSTTIRTCLRCSSRNSKSPIRTTTSESDPERTESRPAK